MTEELTEQQLKHLANMEENKVELDDWQDLNRAVIVRAILDYAAYGYDGDTRREQKIHKDAKYWLFVDISGLLPFAQATDLSIRTIRSAAKRARKAVMTGTLKVQRDITSEHRNIGQLDMFDLWGKNDA